MPVSPIMRAKLMSSATQTPTVKRGEEIFEGSDMSPSFDHFIGQETAVEQIELAMMSAKKRGKRLDHMLLASGIPGLGKTSLAKLIAYNFDVGVVECSGRLSADDLVRLVADMQDHDILFIDECHTLGRNADCLLSLMTDGVILTRNGAVEVADITVIGATTDAGKLTEALLSRFLTKPQLTFYSTDEQSQIVSNLARRLRVHVSPNDYEAVATAANGNPRAMRSILSSLRDMAVVGQYDLAKAFRFCGVTPDGLDQIAQDILLVLLGISTRTASEATIKSLIGESGPIGYSEKILLSRGYMEIVPRGRKLTEEGEQRARDLL